MSLFNTYLEMAQPTTPMKETIYYHGTNTTKNAESIIKNGIDPSYTDIKYGKSKQISRPVKNRVYITTDLSYAIMYALGCNCAGTDMSDTGYFKDHPYGYLFKIKGSELYDIQPDEDSVGGMIVNSIRKKDYKYLYDKVLTERERRLIKYNNEIYNDLIRIGKRALKNMSDHEKLRFIQDGAHISHGGKLTPFECWKIDKSKSVNLDKTGKNFFDISELIWTA